MDSLEQVTYRYSQISTKIYYHGNLHNLCDANGTNYFICINLYHLNKQLTAVKI